MTSVPSAPYDFEKFTGYQLLRRFADLAVWREWDYRLGVHCLGRAIQADDFWEVFNPQKPRLLPRALEREGQQKAQALHGFGRIVRSHYEQRRRLFERQELRERERVLERVRRGTREMTALIPEVGALAKLDREELEALAKPVGEMEAYMAHMCADKRFDQDAFAELESFYDR